jgi:hypothetical protein
MRWALWVVEDHLLCYRDIYAELSNVGVGRGIGSFSVVWSGVCRGFVSTPRILTFLYRTRRPLASACA